MSGPPDETGSDWPRSDFNDGQDTDPTEHTDPAQDAVDQSTDSPKDPPADQPDVEAGDVHTGSGWDPRLHGERRRPTTAEQAVPWLIGMILALAGVCIVLLALIFTGPEGLVANNSSATPSPSGGASPSTAPSTQLSPSVAPSPEATTSPPPSFGPLEMVYLGKATSGGSVTLMRRDFSTTAAAAAVATFSDAVTAATWAPDGRIGAVLVGGKALAVVPGSTPYSLGDQISAMAFGDDSTTLYALRITAGASTDSAEVLAIDAYTADSRSVKTITYPHPVTFPDPPLTEAQFSDNGGLDRLYATVDGYVVVWVLAAPAIYRVDPDSGEVTEVNREPILWSPDTSKRIDVVNASVGKDRLVLRDRLGNGIASISLNGLVSHVRWAGTNNEIVFTLGQYGPGSVVQQNLYVWDLTDGRAPSPLTSDNTSRGAEWLGVAQAWQP